MGITGADNNLPSEIRQQAGDINTQSNEFPKLLVSRATATLSWIQVADGGVVGK